MSTIHTIAPRLAAAMLGAQYDLDMEEWEERKPILHEIAEEAGRYFTGDTRNDGTRFRKLRRDAPSWLTDIVMDAHGDMMPDDWRYGTIENAIDAISDSCCDDRDDVERADVAFGFADNAVDVYTSARFEWLSSNLHRQGYVDEASETFGSSENVVDSIGQGQYMEAQEIFGYVLDGLDSVHADRLEEWEAEEPEAP